MANANAGDNPNDGNPYKGEDKEPGPPDFVFETKQEAQEVARSKGGKAKVSPKIVNGEQRYVVECRFERKHTGASDVDVWRDDL